MLTSIAIILLLGLLAGWLFLKLKLPSLLGMIIVGIILSPNALNLVDESILTISGDLRQIALVIILTRAGLSLNYAKSAGVAVILLVAASLTFRMVGVALSLVKTNLNRKERFFCAVAYTPKATVQAAIGTIPLTMGLPCGEIVLTVAVIAILVTAPFGAICVDNLYKKLLSK